MNEDHVLKIVNIALGLLDVLDNHNIAAQKLLDLRAAKNGEPFTDEDVAKLRSDAQTAIDSIK